MLIAAILILTGCSSNQNSIISATTPPKFGHITSTPTEHGTLLIENKDKEHLPYRLEVPSTWIATETAGGMLVFTENGQSVGGLDIQGYDSTQHIINLLPNHSGPEKTVKLNGEDTEDVFMTLVSEPPAAANDPTKTYSYHAFFPVREKERAFDLYFKSPEVSESQALTIAKSFQAKPD